MLFKEAYILAEQSIRSGKYWIDDKGKIQADKGE